MTWRVAGRSSAFRSYRRDVVVWSRFPNGGGRAPGGLAGGPVVALWWLACGQRSHGGWRRRSEGAGARRKPENMAFGAEDRGHRRAASPRPPREHTPSPQQHSNGTSATHHAWVLDLAFSGTSHVVDFGPGFALLI